MSKEKADVENGSVVFHRIGSVKFWMTTMNRIFCTRGSQVAFPHLQGSGRDPNSGIVKFDDATFEAGQKVIEFARKVLRKQREIRSGWLDHEEESTAFQYS